MRLNVALVVIGTCIHRCTAGSFPAPIEQPSSSPSILETRTSDFQPGIHYSLSCSAEQRRNLTTAINKARLFAYAGYLNTKHRKLDLFKTFFYRSDLQNVRATLLNATQILSQVRHAVYIRCVNDCGNCNGCGDCDGWHAALETRIMPNPPASVINVYPKFFAEPVDVDEPCNELALFLDPTSNATQSIIIFHEFLHIQGLFPGRVGYPDDTLHDGAANFIGAASLVTKIPNKYTDPAILKRDPSFSVENFMYYGVWAFVMDAQLKVCPKKVYPVFGRIKWIKDFMWYAQRNRLRKLQSFGDSLPNLDSHPFDGLINSSDISPYPPTNATDWTDADLRG